MIPGLILACHPHLLTIVSKSTDEVWLIQMSSEQYHTLWDCKSVMLIQNTGDHHCNIL